MAYFEVFYSFFFTSSHSPLNAQGRVLYGYLAIILHYKWRWLNDTWNIVGIASQAKAKIYIFDCYVNSLNKTVRQEWDGTYNGAPTSLKCLLVYFRIYRSTNRRT